MTLTLQELHRVLEEIDEKAGGGNIQKIHQPSDRSVVLQVRVPGETHHIYLCADSGLARVHLLTLVPRNPPSPPQFCKVLRKHLIGTNIRKTELVSGDRIVRFTTEGTNKQNNFIRRSLILEIIPGFENIILLDENDVIIEALQHAESKSGRRIAPKEHYEAPPPFEGAETAGEDRFEEPLRKLRLATYSAAIEREYAGEDQNVREENLRRGINVALSKLEKRAKRRLKAIRRDFEATEKADLLQLEGELLKINLHRVPRGMREVELTDTIEQPGRKLTVKLDPAKSPQDNMKQLFKRARKLRDGREIIKDRLHEAEQEMETLNELRSRLDEATSIEELEDVRDAMPRKERVFGRKVKSPEVKAQPRQFTSFDGQTILVGRNPRQNDDITTHASGNDYWLHVQHYPGSHVIIKMDKDKPLLKETLLDAANLAKHFSKLREADKAPIDYTQRKYVKKPRNSAPGFVTYSQQKTIMLIPDKRRLQRLLQKGRG